MTTSEYIQPKMVRALLVAIFLVGLGLRVHHLAQFPERNETADEFAWTWSGLSLVYEGTPRAWSWLPGYGTVPVLHWRGTEYRMVRPWLDHPPLFPLYVGAFMRASGADDLFAVELRAMRASVLPLFAAAFFLFWAIARRYGGDAPEHRDAQALLALAFYATTPAAVWNGRLVMAEQLMLPIALAGWWALLTYRQTNNKWWLVAVAAATALLPLVKVAALGFALFLFTIAVLERERAAAVAVCIGGVVGLAAYAAYGAHYGWPLFREILREQSLRFDNFGGFYALVFNPRIVDKPFMYLPFLLGFLTLLADLRDGRHAEVGLFAAVYAAAIGFFLPWNDYGWYLIPLYPALCFGLASFVVRAWREPSAGAAWIWFLFSFTYLCWIVCERGVVHPRSFRFVYLALLIALPLAVAATAKRPRAWRIGLGLCVAAQWLGDAWYAFGK